MKEYTLEKALGLPHLSAFNRSTVITDLGLYEDVVIDAYDVRYYKEERYEGHFLETFISGKDANVWFSIRANNDSFMLPCPECKQKQVFKDSAKYLEVERHTIKYKDEQYKSTILSDDCSHTSTFMKDENTLKEERMKSVEMCMRDILSEPFIQREYECGLDSAHKVIVLFAVEKLKLKNKKPDAVIQYEEEMSQWNMLIEKEPNMPEEVRKYYDGIKKVKGYVIMRKIGQYPSMADMQFFESIKYRCVLKSHYRDYSLALGLFASGVGCGSFIYLRRIFEFLIDSLHEECKNEQGWNEEEYRKLDFNSRIQMIESFGKVIIPQELTQVRKKIYGVLSKGGHQNSDQECLEVFTYVKYALEIIMDEQLAQLEKKAKIKELQARLNSF